jgi:hypothetical protein
MIQIRIFKKSKKNRISKFRLKNLDIGFLDFVFLYLIDFKLLNLLDVTVLIFC